MSEPTPWISFRFDASKVQPTTWMLLGEVKSKCEHLVGTPLKPAIADELSTIYLSKGVHATTAIEGNTLPEAEVRDRIAGRGRQLTESQEYLGQEVDNIASAIRHIQESMVAGELSPLRTERILALHARVLEGLDDPPAREPGAIRRHRVGVGTYLAPDPSEVSTLLDQLCAWIEQDIIGSESASERPEQGFMRYVFAAVLVHLYLAWIHPFGDGNGRTARLVEVELLARSGYFPAVSTGLLSDHYNTTRSRYYDQLNRASATGQPYDFLAYAIQGLADKLREQIDVVKAQNRRVAWESYVHEVFARQPNTEAKARQARLALLMPDTWVTKGGATELTPHLIREYATLGPRTPARDLNDLAKMGLVEKRGSRYRSGAALLEAFMSPTAVSASDAPSLDESATLAALDDAAEAATHYDGNLLTVAE